MKICIRCGTESSGDYDSVLEVCPSCDEKSLADKYILIDFVNNMYINETMINEKDFYTWWREKNSEY